jgi:initiation factor 1A
MPNLRGGKAYKKSKGKAKGDDDLENVIFIEKKPDQMTARIVRMLGNRNTSVYCEDNITRICRISSGSRKGTRFEVGDMVLVSLRDCDVPKAELAKGARGDRGDILAKYSPHQYASMKEEGINLKLFAQVDTINAMAMNMSDKPVDDDYFEDGKGRSDSSEEIDDELIDTI